MTFRIIILLLIVTVFMMWAYTHAANGGTLCFAISYHRCTWNILPYVEVDFPSEECQGWSVTIGWLCLSMELNNRG